MKTDIQTVIQDLMDRVMIRVMEKDPFIPEKHHAQKPLYAALVPDEIFKGSHFERRFVTPFGHVWENLASVAAKHEFGQCNQEHMIKGTVKEGRLHRIAEILNQLEHKGKAAERRRPNWDSELAYILGGKGKEIPVNVICDIFVENEQTNERIAFELKGPLPNSDQTKVSKEKLLKLYAMTTPQVDNAYFALPYNPYGKKEAYDWSFPNRWFDMKQDACVLIGDEFWERIGGVGTYQAFLEAVNEISADYKLRIYRDYLGIEPPADFGRGL
jgi:hypothetical protein